MTETNSALVPGNGAALPTASDQQIVSIFEGMLTPFLERMGNFFEQQSRAMEQLAATQSRQSERMDAIEQQIRLNTLVTPQQVRYFNKAINVKAKEQLEKRGVLDAVAVRQISNTIRKSVLMRFGVSALHEMPRCEYDVGMTTIDIWSDLLYVKAVANEARERQDRKI